MIEKVRVLVTCIGGGIGQSVIDSLRIRKDKYFLIGSDGNPFNFAVPDCDLLINLPNIFDNGYVDGLLDIVLEHGVDIIIPGHDAELPLLADSADRFESVGCKVVVSDPKLVSLSRDKLLWSEVFRKYTGKVVASSSVADIRRGEQNTAVCFPAIAKPRGGSASSGLQIVSNSGDLSDVPEDYVVQSFLFPEKSDPDYEIVKQAVDKGSVIQISEISVQLVYSSNGELMGRMATRNRLKGGVPIVIEPIDEPQVWDAVDEVRAVIEQYKPRGPINLQGRLTDKGLVFFELNPRFTGITGNRSQFGFNEVSLTIDNFVHGASRPLFLNYDRVGVRQVACLSRPRSEFVPDTYNKSRQRVLILGGSSWVARNLVPTLIDSDYSVSIVVREQSLPSVSTEFASFGPVEVFSDVSESLHDVISSSDTVINCVSGRPPSGAKNISDSVSYQLRLLNLALDLGVSRIINLSSQSVYREREATITEAEDLDLTAPYAFGKFVIEQFLSSSQLNSRRTSIVSLRLARLFGAGAGIRDNEFPHLVAKKAVSGESVDLFAPDTLLDLLDIRDAVEAILFFVRSQDRFDSEVFNIGSGRITSIKDYVDECARISLQEFSKTINLTISETEPQPDHPGRALDISKVKKLGWTPSHSLESSVRSLMEYYSGS